eukprot:3035628-Ditylum_brightwellii.AAC.1
MPVMSLPTERGRFTHKPSIIAWSASFKEPYNVITPVLHLPHRQRLSLTARYGTPIIVLAVVVVQQEEVSLPHAQIAAPAVPSEAD